MTEPVDLTGRDFDVLTQDERAKILEEVKINRAILAQQQHQSSPRTPHIPTFNGDSSKGFDYQYWKGLIKSLRTSYTDASVIQAIRKSVTSQPAQIVGTLPVDCTLDTIFSALDTAYDLIHDAPTAWQRFYNAKQAPKESLVEWYTRLTGIWSQIPDHGAAELHIKMRLWDGLHLEQLKESSRHHYDNDKITEIEFVKYLRRLTEGKSLPVKPSVNSVQAEGVFDMSSMQVQIAALSSRIDSMNAPPTKQNNPPRNNTKHNRNQSGYANSNHAPHPNTNPYYDNDPYSAYQYRPMHHIPSSNNYSYPAALYDFQPESKSHEYQPNHAPPSIPHQPTQSYDNRPQQFYSNSGSSYYNQQHNFNPSVNPPFNQPRYNNLPRESHSYENQYHAPVSYHNQSPSNATYTNNHQGYRQNRPQQQRPNQNNSYGMKNRLPPKN